MKLHHIAFTICCILAGFLIVTITLERQERYTNQLETTYLAVCTQTFNQMVYAYRAQSDMYEKSLANMTSMRISNKTGGGVIVYCATPVSLSDCPNNQFTVANLQPGESQY